MRKLLAADLYLLRRSAAFWLALFFMAANTTVLVIATYNMLTEYGYDPGAYTIEASMFCMLPGIGIINAIWVHLFIGSDYDEGTIRNKFISGHTRRAIFFSHWLVACIGALVILLASLSFGACLSGYFFRSFMLSTADLALALTSCVLLTVAYAAINVALAMNISRKSSSVVCGMIVMLVLSIFASYLEVMLSSTLVSGWTPVTLKDHLILFIYDLLPSGQCSQINAMMFDHLARWPLYSLILIVLVTAAGYLLFRQKDIK